MKSIYCAALAASIVVAPVSAQVAVAPAAVPSVVTPAISAPTIASIAPAVPESVLRTGTVVPVRILEELTTQGKKLRVGQRFNIEVSEAVMLNGQVVIPAGTPGVGEISSVRNKGMWGKSGNIEARLLYVRVGDRQIRISGAFNDKGVTGTAGVVGAVLLIPVAGFFMTGTSAVIASGSAVKGFLDEDIAVTTFAPTPAAPLAATASTASTTKPESATLTPVSVPPR